MSGGVGEADETAPGDAWNPGLGSEIPRRLQPLVTLYRPENAFLDYADARELAELCGLETTALAALRPERLVVHELLVRVTADFSVPDGPNYEDLGISLRAMVATLLERHVAPEMEVIRGAFDAERERGAALLDRELALRLADPCAADAGESGDGAGGGDAERATRRGWLARLFGARAPARAPLRERGAPHEPPALAALAAWREALGGAEPGLERACLEALIRTVGGIVGRHGRLFADRALIRRIALVLVCNERGAALVGERLAPLVARGAAREGYRALPVQAEPLVMNVKGASASGKSTIRPQQRRLAESLGVRWDDFALISPDYWRKYLLDYASLGDDHRYGAMLTGQELAIIDAKLDRHMAAKAERGEMSHLLIDRFRFDSFTLAKDRTADSRLLTRFGRHVYLFFMLTPPTETVERAWTRGLKTGRYKAVSDLLYHNVEAFTGMPALFLSWVDSDERRVHFEFLDNDVPEGTLPRTAAFGWNGSMTVLDVERLLDIDRYRKLDTDARRPEEVLASADLAPRANLGFVRDCAARIERIAFADRDTGAVYARVEGGRLVWRDAAYLARQPRDGAVRAALEALGDVDGVAADGAAGGAVGAAVRGTADGAADGAADGGARGTVEGAADGAADRAADGGARGTADGTVDGAALGAADAAARGAADGSVDGTADGTAMPAAIDVACEKRFTVGRWGEGARTAAASPTAVS